MLVGQNSGCDTKLERLLCFHDFALRKLFKCEQTYPDVPLNGIQSIAGGTQSICETGIYVACQKIPKPLPLIMSETFFFFPNLFL